MQTGQRSNGTAARDTGITLLELVVSLSIIALLLAISVPILLALRESARRTQCQSRIKRLALACNNFQTTRRHFPPGTLFGVYGTGPDSHAWSWLAHVLPYIGRTQLYEQGDIPQSTLRASEIADRTVTEFLCPSDSHSAGGPRGDAGNMLEHGFFVGLTNYKGVSGANWGADASQNLKHGDIDTPWSNVGVNGSYDGLSDGDGMLFRTDLRVRRRPAHVVDGLSHTFMIGEALPSDDAYCSWPYANNAYSTCAIPPNHPGSGDPHDWPTMLSFRSAHSHGLNFAFADGRVNFINDRIALSVYRGLATIAGQEANVSIDAPPAADSSE